MPDMPNPLGKHGRKRRHPGEGTIIKRRDVWRREPWLVGVPYTDESGRRRKMYRSASSAEEAEAVRLELVRTLARLPARSLTTTLGTWLADWLADMQTTIAPGTWDAYRTHIEKRLLPTLGHLPLASVTPAEVRAAARRWKGSASTREGTTIVLRSALLAAERDGLLETSPARFLRAPKRAAKPPAPVDVDDARLLLAAARGERLYPLLVAMLGLGLRRGEALGLRTSDVDLAAGTVRIAHSLRRIPVSYREPGEAAVRLVAPKAGSYRVLPLPPFVADALAARLAELDAERRAAKVWAPNELVFCGPDGNPVSFSRLARWFTDLLARTNLPPMRLHDLRGSTATILLAEGVDLRVVQAILGHKNIGQTAAYARVLPRVTGDASKRLQEALG